MGYFSALATAGKFLAPHLTRAGLTLTGLAAGGQAISRGSRALNEDFAETLGVTPTSIAEGENFDPTKGTSGKITDWDGGDTLRSLFTGVGKQEVEKAAREQFQTEMTDLATNRNAKQKRRATALGLGDTFQPLAYQNKEGETGFTERLDERGAILDQLETLRALNPEIAKQYNLSSGSAELLNAIDSARHERNKGREGSAEWTAIQNNTRAGKADDRADTQIQQNAYQFQVQQQQIAASERNRNAQLDADRELRRGEGKDRMELAILDREGQREELRYRREDRADARRRDSMMMLMKGLSQLGAGFAL